VHLIDAISGIILPKALCSDAICAFIKKETPIEKLRLSGGAVGHGMVG